MRRVSLPGRLACSSHESARFVRGGRECRCATASDDPPGNKLRASPAGGVLEDDGADRGIVFVFAGAHLSRQFEFVKSQWVNEGTFIGASPSKTH